MIELVSSASAKPDDLIGVNIYVLFVVTGVAFPRACGLPLENYGETLGHPERPNAVKCPRMPRQIRDIAIGVTDER